MWFFCYDIDEILGCRQRRKGVGSYTEEWLNAWAERVIREVDNSELISAGMVYNLLLGPIMENFIRWIRSILNLTG